MGGSPVPPGTNLSTDYSSTESIETACAEHAETLLRIVTPPELEEHSSEDDEEEGEEREGEGEGAVGSVRVSEWELERTLNLRGDNVEGEGEGEGEEKGMMDTLTSADCVLAREVASEDNDKSLSDSHTQIQTVETIHPKSPPHTLNQSETGTAQGPGPDSPFSLSFLGLPSTPVSVTHPASQLQPGMAWWAEALAETQNMDDIDALVEQLEGKQNNLMVTEKRKKEERVCVEDRVSEEMIVKLSSVGELEGKEREGGGERGEGKVDVLKRERRRVHEEVIDDTSTSGRSIVEDHTPQTNQTVVNQGDSLVINIPNDQSHVRRSPSPSMASTNSAHSEDVAYITQAGRLIRMALQYEQQREFEEAFDLFKAAVDVLLNGVQSKEITCHVTVM